MFRMFDVGCRVRGDLVLGLTIAALLLFGSSWLSNALPWLWRVLAWTAINQSLVVVGFAIALVATGVHASVPALLSVAAVSTASAMVPVSVSGYGIRELALALLAPKFGLDAK